MTVADYKETGAGSGFDWINSGMFEYTGKPLVD